MLYLSQGFSFCHTVYHKTLLSLCRLTLKGEQIMGNKIYPIGIQSFEKIRKNGYFYVDKTALIYRLV